MSEQEDCLSVNASSWSTSETSRLHTPSDMFAELSEGNETVNEIEEIEEWELVDEVGESDSDDNRGDTTSEAPRLVVEEPSLDPPETTNFLDNITITVQQDYLQRSVKATRLTKDLRLRESHSFRPGPSGPSGDREPSSSTITLPDSNILPRG